MSFGLQEVSTTVVSPTMYHLLWHFAYCRFAYIGKTTTTTQHEQQKIDLTW